MQSAANIRNGYYRGILICGIMLFGAISVMASNPATDLHTTVQDIATQGTYNTNYNKKALTQAEAEAIANQACTSQTVRDMKIFETTTTSNSTPTTNYDYKQCTTAAMALLGTHIKSEKETEGCGEIRNEYGKTESACNAIKGQIDTLITDEVPFLVKCKRAYVKCIRKDSLVDADEKKACEFVKKRNIDDSKIENFADKLEERKSELTKKFSSLVEKIQKDGEAQKNMPVQILGKKNDLALQIQAEEQKRRDDLETLNVESKMEANALLEKVATLQREQLTLLTERPLAIRQKYDQQILAANLACIEEGEEKEKNQMEARRQGQQRPSISQQARMKGTPEQRAQQLVNICLASAAHLTKLANISNSMRLELQALNNDIKAADTQMLNLNDRLKTLGLQRAVAAQTLNTKTQTKMLAKQQELRELEMLERRLPQQNMLALFNAAQEQSQIASEFQELNKSFSELDKLKDIDITKDQFDLITALSEVPENKSWVTALEKDYMICGKMEIDELEKQQNNSTK